MPQAVQRPPSNLVLRAIEAESSAAFRQQSKIVELQRGAVLCDTGDRMRHAFFPMGCVLSTLAILSDGSSLEVNVVGVEGAFGIIGSSEAAARVVVLVGGKAARLPMRDVRTEFERSWRVRAVVVRHVENLLFQIQQSAVCAARHSIEARLCRWLLTVQDRAPGDSLHVTHEFVAGHLGANRTSVTLAAAALQRAGLVTYRRGVMVIRDRAGLEEASCECYRAIRDRIRRLLRLP